MADKKTIDENKAAEDNKAAEENVAVATPEAPAPEAPAPEAPATEAPAPEVSAPADTSSDNAAPDNTGMAALETLRDATPEPVIAEPKIDSLGRSYATGRRKDASARVWVKRGTGRVLVNGKDVSEYFARPVLRMLLAQPFEVAGRKDEFDVIATVRGGGLSGQAGAVRHGISHALIRFEPDLRPPLKAGGFLTRDSRVVERKKYGKRKARRSFQFSKR